MSASSNWHYRSVVAGAEHCSVSGMSAHSPRGWRRINMQAVDHASGRNTRQNNAEGAG
jgi:hypothetical protein